MPQIKVILVSIFNPQNYKGTYVISGNKIYEFLSSDGAAHMLKRTEDGKTEMKSFGKLYQMVGYDPSAEEENQFLPIAFDQWRLSTRFISRDEYQDLRTTLTDIKGMPWKLHWQNARLDVDGYRLFKTVEIKKE